MLGQFHNKTKGFIIVDCFDYNRESYMLFHRIERLYSYVDPPAHYYTLRGPYYQLTYRRKCDNEWKRPFVVRYGSIRMGFQSYRQKRENAIPNSITHCTYCFRYTSDIIRKFQGFSHVEYNQWPFIDSNYIWAIANTTLDIALPWQHCNYSEITHPDVYSNDPRLKYLVEAVDFLDNC